MDGVAIYSPMKKIMLDEHVKRIVPIAIFVHECVFLQRLPNKNRIAELDEKDTRYSTRVEAGGGTFHVKI